MFYKLKDMDFKGKRVLMRVDFNVTVKDGHIIDDTRMQKALPSIKHVLQSAKQVILISHLGRPGGEYQPDLTMKPVAEHLQQLVGRQVYFETNPHIKNLQTVTEAPLVMLENLRFDREEKEHDEGFAKHLASFCDIFVLDAFGVAHRDHASVSGVPRHVPSCAGLLLEKEVTFLKDATDNPQRPYRAIIGGAKTDKIDVINKLIEKVDHLIVGGVLANTFLKAAGVDIGASKYDETSLEQAARLLQQHGDKIDLPVDFILGDRLADDAQTRVAGVNDPLDSWMILDIGPYTISGYKKLLDDARTVVWAGPIGAFEYAPFRRGTWDIANHLAQLDITKIIGGGDSGKAVYLFGLAGSMTHISTGGGASLALLAGKPLPGLEALEKNYEHYK